MIAPANTYIHYRIPHWNHFSRYQFFFQSIKAPLKQDTDFFKFPANLQHTTDMIDSKDLKEDSKHDRTSQHIHTLLDSPSESIHVQRSRGKSTAELSVKSEDLHQVCLRVHHVEHFE